MAKQDDVTRRLQAARQAGALALARKIVSRRERVIAELKLIRTWIERVDLELEPVVQETAWVQYRYMSPLDRTELFTQAYRAVYVEMIATHFPDDDPSKKNPIEAEFARNSFADMKCLWNARQMADMLGVPYDLYLRKVMEGLLVNGKWKRPPRPNQLIDDQTGPRLRGALDRDELMERLYGADWDPRFKATVYTGDPVQETALQMVVPIIRDADQPASVLAEYLCERQVIAWERAEELFGEQLVAEAMELSSRPALSGLAEGRPVTPACAGLPAVSDSSPCTTCRVVDPCLLLAKRVREDLIASTGSDDPRAAGKRHKANMRKRKQRENQRANDQTRS
ncbi:hypothetical protein LYSHEL_01670 [Lysobacter helvus]|uniref:Uncharacterized protein n=2 Tax=Lysobacteraceae TaxID=32033 RepID=A0ABN6FNM5_9GAMM|nr:MULTISPECIES: hypothetical protein [Lysobacter]BCT91143.1 hypothetical protein LYSCAS_01670 [Lysobacter caseinilyticus]BCT94296.1 hypothetical protein LYSHEL_01670 [Lysobacter helvus]